MAPRSPSDAPADPWTLVEAQLRECYGRVVYTHKTHEKCADILLGRLSVIKVWQIILSAITTAGFLAAILGPGPIGAIVGIVVSTALLALNTYTKSYDLGSLAQKHRQAAADLWLIREEYLALITDLRVGETTIDAIVVRRDRLLRKLHEAYSGAPSTSYSAYRKAQEALKNQEEMTFSDVEIDVFLPQALRKGNGSRDT